MSCPPIPSCGKRIHAWGGWWLPHSPRLQRQMTNTRTTDCARPSWLQRGRSILTDCEQVTVYSEVMMSAQDKGLHFSSAVVLDLILLSFHGSNLKGHVATLLQRLLFWLQHLGYQWPEFGSTCCQELPGTNHLKLGYFHTFAFQIGLTRDRAQARFLY